MSKVHEATVPVDLGGTIYFTANWRRFFLGRPEVENVALYRGPGRRTRYTEVKHPRVLKALRRQGPGRRPAEVEDVGAERFTVPAMTVASQVCDKPSEYEERMAKRARERAKKYAVKWTLS